MKDYPYLYRGSLAEARRRNQIDLDVAFSDGTHTTVENWEVDNGARLFTWTHPQNNHDPATVTVQGGQGPGGYLLDPPLRRR